MNCSFGLVTKKPQENAMLYQVVKQQRRKQQAKVTLVFCVRRPGCGFCREHGLQLSELAKTENLALIGVIKGDSIDNECALDFYTSYFRFPLYSDDKLTLFKHILGERTIGIIKFLKGVVGSSAKRHAKKNIANRLNTSEDGLTQGGICIFDSTGELRHVHYESFGEELDIEALRQVIRDVEASQ
jgi:hypothetical protein